MKIKYCDLSKVPSLISILKSNQLMSFRTLHSPFLLLKSSSLVSEHIFKAKNKWQYSEVANLRMSGVAGTSSPIPVWLDCDPGHDDAFAILLAAQSTQQIKLLGISIVHGNDTVDHCAKNALRMLWACGVKVPVYKGIQTPLIRKPKFCPEIHGIPGEQGVAGMCGYHFPDHKIFNAEDDNRTKVDETHGVVAMSKAIRDHPSKVTVVLTGAQTNFAFCLRMFPEIKDNVEKVVFMGGAIGLGNTGVAAEFNIQIDPEAASIVFHSGIPLVMIPLEVTHKVLVTPDILNKLANIDNINIGPSSETDSCSTFNSTRLPHRHVEYPEVFKAVDRHGRRKARGEAEDRTDLAASADPSPETFSSQFAECCYKLLTFFQGTYCREFGFTSPPLHDPCTIFYLTNPECFKTVHLFVDVETESEKCAGRTLCDMNNLLGKKKNVLVCTDIDTDKFWEMMVACVKMVSEKSPMNVPL